MKKGNEISPEKSALLSTLKPPRSAPSKTAALESLRVHFAYTVREKVLGFTFIYSDGVEMRVGEICCSKEVVLKLDKGEHIVGVQPDFYCYWPNYVTGLRFRTTKGRYLLGARA